MKTIPPFFRPQRPIEHGRTLHKVKAAHGGACLFDNKKNGKNKNKKQLRYPGVNLEDLGRYLETISTLTWLPSLSPKATRGKNSCCDEGNADFGSPDRWLPEKQSEPQSRNRRQVTEQHDRPDKPRI
jgi:hypothetical protein